MELSLSCGVRLVPYAFEVLLLLCQTHTRHQRVTLQTIAVTIKRRMTATAASGVTKIFGIAIRLLHSPQGASETTDQDDNQENDDYDNQQLNQTEFHGNLSALLHHLVHEIGQGVLVRRRLIRSASKGTGQDFLSR